MVKAEKEVSYLMGTNECWNECYLFSLHIYRENYEVYWRYTEKINLIYMLVKVKLSLCLTN
jgi:hypothetical protein